MKLKAKPNGYYVFLCNGCNREHVFFTGAGGWEFNGDLERPTFKPSLLNHGTIAVPRCHLNLTDGVIHYSSDSTHALAGKSVPLPEFGG